MLEGAGLPRDRPRACRCRRRRSSPACRSTSPTSSGFSAFLTTTMPMFKANINALNKAGLRDQVIVMVGGAPVTQEYADAVGADGYAADASTAVRRAKELHRRQARRRRRLTRPTSSGARHAHGRLLGHARGRHRPRPAVLPHRRADQPDRAPARSPRSCAPGDLSRIERRRRPSRWPAARRCSTSTWACRSPTRPSCCPAAVTLVQELTDLPICIDSSVVEALDAGPARSTRARRWSTRSPGSGSGSTRSCRWSSGTARR